MYKESFKSVVFGSIDIIIAVGGLATITFTVIKFLFIWLFIIMTKYEIGYY